MPVTDPLSKLWKDLPSKRGLQKFAHRSGLDYRPLDDEFKQYWLDLEKVFSGILERFEEKFSLIFLKLDELAAKENPTSQDAAYLACKIPNNPVAHEHFYKNVKSSFWLEMSDIRKLIQKVPGLVESSDGYYHQPWPASPYLERMATQTPTKVVEVLLDVTDYKNGRVVGSLLSIAAKLPISERTDVLERAEAWIKSSGHHSVGYSARDLIQTLLKEGQFDDAIRLARVLLEIQPKNHGNEPTSRLGDSELEDFFARDFKPAIESAPQQVFPLAAGLLEDFVRLDNEGRNGFDDLMYIARPAIEDHGQNKSFRDIENALVVTVRDCARAWVQQDPQFLPEIVAELEAKRWTVFRRIALCLLADFSSAAPSLVAERLTDKALFEEDNIWHEYARLLNVAFNQLSEEQKQAILGGKMPGFLHVSSCTNPEECESLPRYFPELIDDHIYSIATSLPKNKLIAFLERGLLKSEQVPADVMAEFGNLKLPTNKTAEPVITIDKEAIGADLESLQYPLYFLDYETFFPAVPLFDGYRPYQHAVFQYSVHVMREPGAEPEHFEFLADECVDPAPEIAASLAKHIGEVGSIIVWNARFEASRNAEVGELLPATAEFMASINDRMYDLMMIVRKGYYVDSRFGGSASLKKVLPVTCPELSYNDLAIHEGGTASASWATLTDPTTPPEAKEQLKKDMLAYCGLDTYAMVAIYRKFAELSSTPLSTNKIS